MTIPPHPPGVRHREMDIIRGVAVMGILMMNILGFALPEPALYTPRAWLADSPGNDLLWGIGLVLIDNKMRGLFSLLFGASMLMLITTSEERGEDGLKRHRLRMFWLLFFGLIHYYLIWEGDILTLYAIIGLFAAAFIHAPARTLVRLAIPAFLLALALWAMILGPSLLALVQVHLGMADTAMAEAAAAAIADWGGTPETLAADMAYYRSDYVTLLLGRASEEAAQPLWLLLLFGPETLGLMLLGMAGLKSGFLTGQWDETRYKRWLLICYALSVPPMVLMTAWCFGWNGDPALGAIVSLFLSLPFRIIMVIGHAALILWLAKRFLAHPLTLRIEAAGKLAFSNYLGTSIIMTTLFYGYGFGLFGQVSRIEAYGVALAMCAVMLIWSPLWLRYFRQGPLEWLWRSLVAGKAQPLRR